MNARSWITAVLVCAAANPARAAVLTPQWTYDPVVHGYAVKDDFRGNWRAVAVSDSAVLLRHPDGTAVVAVEKATGKQLWAVDSSARLICFPFANWYRLAGSDDALVATYIPTMKKVEIRSVRTGNAIDPLSQAGRDLLRGAGVEKVSLLAAAGPGAVLVADILTGDVRSVAMPKDYQIDGRSWVVFQDEGRVCVRIDTDDGGVGHSVWPKYLYCCTLAGKKPWQFPKMFHFRDSIATNSVDAAFYVKPARVVVALAEDGSFGLRSRDGKVLWQKRTLGLKSPAVFRQGILGLDSDTSVQTSSSLVYIDTRTGARRVLGSVPRSDALFVVEDTVFVAERERISMVGCVPAR